MIVVKIPIKQTTTINAIDIFSPHTAYIRRNSYFPYAILVFRAGDSQSVTEIALHFDNREILRETLKQLLKDIGE
jgi:hypothetical protein